MNRAIVGLGSNIDPKIHMEEAMRRLARDYTILRKSARIQTVAIAREVQPDYLNRVVMIETDLSLPDLAAGLKEMERAMGRIRSSDKYAPRTIDLDVLVYNGRIVDEDVNEREFLRTLILQVWPGFDEDPVARRE